MDFVDELLKIWCEEFKNYRPNEYIITNLGKDRSGIGKLLKLVKAKNPTADAEKTKQLFRKLFKQCLNIEEPFFYDGMSPAFIYSQINRIKAKFEKKIEILTHYQVAAKEKEYGITIWSKYEKINIDGQMKYILATDFDPKKHVKWVLKPPQQVKITGYYENGKKTERPEESLVDIYNEAAKTQGHNLIGAKEDDKMAKFRKRFDRRS